MKRKKKKVKRKEVLLELLSWYREEHGSLYHAMPSSARLHTSMGYCSVEREELEHTVLPLAETH